MAIDKELIKALSLMKHGKEEGFNTLYMHTHNYVYGRAKLIMKNEEDALDLTQEVFVQAYKGIDKLENANNLYAWLGAITYNQGMKMFNKKTDILVEEDGDYIFEEIVSTDKDSSPEATAEEKAVAEVVMDMIEELPELQKTALVAFYYDNMKIEDIAVMCECSANTIKSRLNYAKKFLKEKVESHEKANGYKLHSITPIFILWAFREAFSKATYVMSEAATHTVYVGVCQMEGITGSATLTGVSVNAANATSKVGTITSAATKAGMTLGAKIGIMVTTVIAASGVTVGAVMMANNKSVENKSETPITEEQPQEMEKSDAEQELPQDRAWIDDLYNKLISDDYEGVIAILEDDKIEKDAEPYLIHSENFKNDYDGDDFWNYYKLVTTDGKIVGLELYIDDAGYYSREVFYSDKKERDYGFDFVGIGDKSVEYCLRVDTGENDWYFFDGTYLHYSHGGSYDVKADCERLGTEVWQSHYISLE